MNKEQITPLVLANTFIDVFKDKERLTHLKLQKICYFAYCEWLVKHGTRLLTEEPAVYKYGPVFASLFEVLKHMNNREITKIDQIKLFSAIGIVTDQEIIEFMREIWEIYSKTDARTLSELSHGKNTPWGKYVVAYKRKVKVGSTLSDEIIKEYFVRPTSEELAKTPKELNGGIQLSKSDNYGKDILKEGFYKARIIAVYKDYKGFFFNRKEILIVVWSIQSGEFKNFIYKQKLKLWSKDSFVREEARSNLFAMRECLLGYEEDGSVIELMNTNQLIGLEADIKIEEIEPGGKKLITKIAGRYY